MRAFLLVWFGQLVSLLGSGMTGFGLAIWAWQETGQASALALVGFFSFGPTVLLSPLAGALVDRWNRKMVMMLSDLATGLSTIVVLFLYATGQLEVWHLYITGAFAGAFQAFQFPAYSAAITTMISKAQYARANGLLSLAESSSQIAAPLLAGFLIGLVGIQGILLIDVVTFCFALLTLALIHVPQPRATEAGQEGKGSLWFESMYGFRYILKRPSLLGLQLVFLGMNLVGAFFYTLVQPMILARTGDDAALLGSVLAFGGIGGVMGGVVMSTWGGPKQRIHGVLGGMALSSLLGSVVVGIGQGLPLWAGGMFLASFFLPVLNGSNQAIWQAKVAPDVQGRVFAVRRLIAQISAPLAMVLAGFLADYLFEPAMQPGGNLAPLFGEMLGTGPGAGMSLMILGSGVLGLAFAVGGYLFPAIRHAESLLPDHIASSEAEEVPVARPVEGQEGLAMEGAV
ncbi:MAG: MFS transporter [Ardenticatenales bacterium]|nr:MFS transporter [Ardenticatenales bacterium]